VRVALDATYSVDPQPSGIAVYSLELLNGLAVMYSEHRFVHCYRPKQLLRARRPCYANIRRALLLPPFPSFSADLFHALNQRVDRRPARKVVATFHDLFVMTGDYSSSEFRQRFTEQARGAAARSDLIIAVSEFTAGQVANLLGVERERMRIVSHGVVSVPPRPDLRRENLVLFVGALQARKNVRRLVEAFETLDASWRLILAGAPSGYRAEEIVERINRSPSRSRIDVTGYVSREKLNELLARASIFAFPSLDEGFGIPVLEAMSSGLPVITSNGSALGELARDSALLVNPVETEEIAVALQTLANDVSLRTRLAAAGNQRAALFSWENAVRKTFEVYSELI
jgi:O-antigen biosynthesis alpha-1,2-mannosyltransferase